MIHPRATELLLFAVMCALVLWEMAAVRWGAPGSTISDVMHAAAVKYPEVPLFVGLIVGHCLWGSK